MKRRSFVGLASALCLGIGCVAPVRADAAITDFWISTPIDVDSPDIPFGIYFSGLVSTNQYWLKFYFYDSSSALFDLQQSVVGYQGLESAFFEDGHFPVDTYTVKAEVWDYANGGPTGANPLATAWDGFTVTP